MNQPQFSVEFEEWWASTDLHKTAVANGVSVMGLALKEVAWRGWQARGEQLLKGAGKEHDR